MNAIGITSYTLIGVVGPPPVSHGNCFSVAADDGKEYRIINFYFENLKALMVQGLAFPVAIHVLDLGVALIEDGRIGERWYARRYCEVCCPPHLLPSIQVDAHRRDVMRGRRREHEDGGVTLDMTVGAEFL